MSDFEYRMSRDFLSGAVWINISYHVTQINCHNPTHEDINWGLPPKWEKGINLCIFISSKIINKIPIFL